MGTGPNGTNLGVTHSGARSYSLIASPFSVALSGGGALVDRRVACWRASTLSAAEAAQERAWEASVVSA